MGKVKKVPDGYHTVSQFFCVKGAAEAIELWKKAFGAEERFRMPGPNGTIMHAEIQLGDSIVMVTDSVNEAPTVSATHLYVDDVDAAFKRATAAGCTTLMPPTDMPWGDRFCRMQDKWGNRWGVATHIEDVSPEEVGRRMAAMKK